MVEASLGTLSQYLAARDGTASTEQTCSTPTLLMERLAHRRAARAEYWVTAVMSSCCTLHSEYGRWY